MREGLAGNLEDGVLVLPDGVLQVLDPEPRDVVGASLLQHGLPERFEVRLVLDPQRYVRELLGEAQVAVPGEVPVAALAGEALQGLVVEAEVEDRIHHAWHGYGCPTPYRDKQG